MWYFAVLYTASLTAVQLLAGSTPASAFSFPVNVALGAAWLYGTWFAWRYMRRLRPVAALFSGRMSITALALLALCASAAGLFPQTGAETPDGLWQRLGFYHIQSSWILRGIVLLVSTNLTGVIFSHMKSPRAGFLFSHAGLWLVLAAGLWGGPDRKDLRVQLFPGRETDRAYEAGGGAAPTPFTLKLLRFDMDRYPDGSPSGFSARLETGDGKMLEASVNDPARCEGWSIYTAGYDSASPGEPRYCIVQLVRDPWRPAMLAGILSLIAGAVLMLVRGPGHPEKRTVV